MSKKRHIPKAEGKFIYLRQILLQIKGDHNSLEKKLKLIKLFSDKLNKLIESKSSSKFRKLYKKIAELDEELKQIYAEYVIPELEKQKISIKNIASLTGEETEFANNIFEKQIKPVLTPYAINEDSVQSFFKDGHRFFILKTEPTQSQIGNPEVTDKETKTDYQYILIEIPASIPKYINFFDTGTKIISSDEVIALNLEKILPQQQIISQNILTSYSKDEEKNEFIFFIQKKSKGIKKLLNTGEKNIFKELFYPGIIDKISYINKKLNFKDENIEPIVNPAFNKSASIIETISKEDIYLHFPYHSFEYIIKFFHEVSKDPFVSEIKITQSELIQNPNIIVSFLDALKAGKRVNIYVDENTDMNTLNEFRESGINVISNALEMQIDCEAALIKRRENDGEKNYVYFSTKNSSSGKNSTDIALLTSDSIIAIDLNYFFNFLELGTKGFEFEELLVSGLNMRKSFAELIENEIINAKQGKDAFIMLKMNKLEDKKLINLLFDAGDSDVKIKLLVSESCLLKPENWNENIQIKYLINTLGEHSKIFIFYNDGEPVIYISSLDWTKQSFSKKIGLAVPIKQTNLRTMLVEMINLYSRNDSSAVYKYLSS